MKRSTATLIFLSLVFAAAGCRHFTYDDSGNGNPENTVVLSGTAACPDEAGVFELTFDSNNDSVVTGTLSYGGDSYPLTGTYVAGTGSVNAHYTESDPQFVLTGTFTSGSSFNGQIVRTIESVETICTVSGQEENESGSVENYLGTFGFEDSDDGAGTWNMSIQAGVAVGSYARSVGPIRGTFSGTVSGSMLTIDTFKIYDPDTGIYYDLLDVYPTATGEASGTFDDGDINGSWSWEPQGSGLFAGTLQE
jgi:hypothetical protein